MYNIVRFSIVALTTLVSTAAVANSTVLEDRLESIARHYGNSANQIPFPLDTGETKFFAHEVNGSYSIYHSGDTVSEDTTLAVCSIDAAGGPTECHDGYGHVALLGLEFAANQQVDPHEMSFKCEPEHLGGETVKCVMNWGNGQTSCFYYTGGEWHTHYSCQ